MTTAQATEATAFIVHPALRAQAAAALIVGRTFLCPDCGQIANPDTGCTPCDDVKFASLCAEYDLMMANAETYDPYEAHEIALENAMAGRKVTGGSRHSEI
jgi:hypothetical protein